MRPLRFLPVPRRRSITLVAVAVGVVAVAVGFLWLRHGRAEVRHVNALIALGYEHSGFADQPDPTLQGYDRDTFRGGCGDIDDEWVGGRTGTRNDPTVDWLGGAPPAANAFGADGWEVLRWESTGADSPRRWVVAARAEDRLVIVYDPASITISASSGPCQPAIALPDPPVGAREVDEFTPIELGGVAGG